MVSFNPAPYFSKLPTELHLAIIANLPLLDTYCLRLTSRQFYNLIHPPTPSSLTDIESTDWARDKSLLTCGGCIRLRHASHFSSDRSYLPRSLRSRRFCLECGHRPLPGSHRYQEGTSWHEDGVLLVRCRTCKGIVRTRPGRSVCEKCCEREIRMEARTEWSSYDGKEERGR